MKLRSLLRRLSVADRLILLSGYPQAMQKHRELACHGNRRTLLRGFAASFRELQTEATKLRIRSNETEWIRFRFVMSNLFGHYEHLYFQHRAGLAEPEYWESRAANMEWYFAQPGWHAYWDEAGRLFGQGFRESQSSL